MKSVGTDYFIIYVYEVLSNNWCMHVYFMVYTARTTIKNNILKLAVNHRGSAW